MINWFIKRSRSTLSVLTLLILWGGWSYFVIPVSAEPEITVPFVSVSTVIEGASPEDVVRLVTRPLEERISEVEGVQEVDSYSRIGYSTIIAEFDVSFDVDQAIYDMRQAVDEARSDLPESIRDPVVSSYNTRDFPLMTLAVYGDNVSEDVLVRVSERLEEEFERLKEVEDAQLKGVREEVVVVEVDKEQLESYGLSLLQVAQLVRANNLLIQAGVQENQHGRFAVEVPGTLQSAQDILQLPLKVVQGTVVTLGDVAIIKKGYKDPESFARINGRNAISIDIIRAPDANDISTSRSVRAVASGAQQLLPPGVSLTVANDDSTWAEDMVSQLTGNIVTAVALVMTLVVAVLGFKSGLLVGMGIPVSFLAGFIVLNGIGLAFNFMVMFGFLLSMGMLIDGSIVVVELAARARAAGLSIRDAYAFSARRMFWPIVASAATTLAAFIPLMVWPGVTGKFMQYLPITVFAVLSASLFYSLIFTPVLGIVLARTFEKDSDQIADVDAGTDLSDIELSGSDTATMMASNVVYRGYGRIMNWCCDRPLFLTAAVILLLLIIIRAWSDFGAGTSFFVSTEPTHASIKIKSRGNFSLSETEDLSVDVDRRINNLSELETRYLNSGTASFGGSRGGAADQISNIFLEIAPQEDRTRSGYEVLDEVRERLSDIPGLIVQVTRFQDGPPVGSPMEVKVLSLNAALAEEVAGQLNDFMETQSGLINVTTDLPVRQMEWEIDVDKVRAASMGVSLAEIGAAVQMVTEGVKVDEYLPEDSKDTVDILVRLPSEQRTLAQLDRMLVQTPGGLVPLSSFVKVRPAASQKTIARSDEQYRFRVTADVTSADVLVSDKVKEVEQWRKDSGISDDVQFEMGGQQESQQETVLFLAEAAGVALFLMLILLVTQFNSFYQALLILSAVLMSVAGVLLMLLLTGTVMSVVMGGMGLVTLAGVVVNNNIVLLDTFNHLRRQNPEMSVRDAAISTGLQRLRPVLLTTATTVCGMLPLAFAVSVDLLEQTIEPGSRVASYWTQLASTLAAGLSFSTLLTLVFIPASLVLPSHLRQRYAALKQRFSRSAELEPV